MSLATQIKLLLSRSTSKGLGNSYHFFVHTASQFFEHSTPRKFVNMIGVKAQKWVKVDKVIGMPFLYTIDPINVCNLHCPVCSTGLGILGRSRGKISLENYKKVIDQVAPYAYKVILYNWGEPFLHPDIFEIIQYASSQRIEVQISSNLNRFSQEMSEKTVQSGLDTLLVSVDGATQEVYEKYRRSGNLSRVIENLRILVETKRRLGSSKPFIFIRMLVNRYNESQIDEMRRLAESIGVDAFTVGVLYVDTNNPDQIEEWLPENAKYSAYKKSSEKLTNVWHCADLWEGMTINWDGGVAPCCWLQDEKNDFCNAFEQPIRDIWNSDAYISSRRVFALGRAKAGPISTICTRCKGRPQYLMD